MHSSAFNRTFASGPDLRPPGFDVSFIADADEGLAGQREDQTTIRPEQGPGVSAGLVGVIIADDLTGACDAGVHFSARGFRTQVDVGSETRVDIGASVIVFNTDTRCADPTLAEIRAEGAAQAAYDLGPRILFKKIDSTFRGHPALEIAAILRHSGRRLAIVAPAFPAAGRTVSGGRIRASGMHSEIEIAKFFAGLSWKHIAVQDIPHLRRLAAQEMRLGTHALVIDAVAQQDLYQIALLALEEPGLLWVGSGGLAQALAEVFAGQKLVVRQKPQPGHPVLICVGSDHAVTAIQVQRVCQGREIPSLSADDSGYADTKCWLSQGRDVIIRFSREQMEQAPDRELANKLGVRCCGGLVVTGGDTALYVLRSLGVNAVALKDEVQPGIPWGTMMGGEMNGKPLITKSGAFGKSSALLECLQLFDLPAKRRLRADA